MYSHHYRVVEAEDKEWEERNNKPISESNPLAVIKTFEYWNTISGNKTCKRVNQIMSTDNLALLSIGIKNPYTSKLTCTCKSGITIQ